MAILMPVKSLKFLQKAIALVLNGTKKLGTLMKTLKKFEGKIIIAVVRDYDENSHQ